ncbi:hypothetical protein RHECNPAF_4300113 [Rhizobium etli CNPAF512]|nr:hypothetical protein RHECNPAF_4300113 [Rhizobium etli CNPAF512]
MHAVRRLAVAPNDMGEKAATARRQTPQARIARHHALMSTGFRRASP